MHKFYFLIMFSAFFISVNAQQKIIAKFIITDAAINNKDATEWYLDAGGYIVFYSDDNNNFCMSNFMSKRNTQSYGRLYSVKSHRDEESVENYQSDIFKFNWAYKNTYNSKSGTAKVFLTKVYKPQGVFFICKIIPENLDVLVYKGYMDGSLDFSDFID